MKRGCRWKLKSFHGDQLVSLEGVFDFEDHNKFNRFKDINYTLIAWGYGVHLNPHILNKIQLL